MSTRSDVTKRRLYDAAIELIGEKGFTEASVDEIVERAGVAKGTVYYHFESKAELVDELIEDQLRPLAQAFREAAAQHPDDPCDAIEAIVASELRFMSERQAFAKLLISELWREDRVWRRTLLLAREELHQVIRDVIQIGLDSGEFRGDIDPAFGASALFGMTATVALDWLAFEPERPLEEVAGQIARAASHALRVC